MKTPRSILLVAAAALSLAACRTASNADAVTATTATPSSSPPSTTGEIGESDDESSTTPSTEPVAATTEPAEPTIPPTPSDPLSIETDLGRVQGTGSAVEGVRAFLGVPYAEAPVGELRWAPPQRRTPWDDSFDATSPGAACPQRTDGITAQFTVLPEIDDDCLSLSVWAPAGADDAPVMVWFHGGGFTSGSAHQPYYIGDHLAERGTVVVNVNYRIGALGFLEGNHGFLDQVEALDWVQRNIVAFGGDAERVTIFGESAGGFSVCAHLATPQPAVFHQAIIQSGGGCDALQPLDDATAVATEYLAAVGCADLECARALATDELLAVPFDARLVNDEITLDRTAADLARAGELATIPLLTGFNADESTLFTLGQEEPDDAFLIDFAAQFTDDPAAVVALYPRDQFATNLARYQELNTDLTFGCTSLRFAELTDETYAYHFTHVSEATPFDLGATHGAELAFVFGHPEGLTLLEADLNPTDAAVADAIQATWTRFAATGEPGWDRYDEGRGVMAFGAEPEFVETVRDGRCPIVDGLLR